MPINNDSMAKIEAMLRMESGSLASAINSEEEVSLEIPNLVYKTEEEYDTLKENLRIAGMEIAVKEAKERAGLEFEGKSIENLLVAHKQQVVEKTKEELGGSDDARVKSLEKDILAIQETANSYKSRIDVLESEKESIKNETKIHSTILGAIPDQSTLSIDAKDLMTLYKAQSSLAIEDGKVVVKNEAGEIKKDDLLNPISPESDIKEFAQKYAKAPTGGRPSEGSDPGGLTPGSWEAFVKEMEDNGTKVGSEEFHKIRMERQKNGTLKMS